MSDTTHLGESMSNLRSQISALDIEDDHTRQRLSGLVDDIEKTLGRSGDVRAHENLGERLKASIVQFEVSHPRIAVVLNELAEKLSNMGI